MNNSQMIGTIVEFNSAYDDWNVYYERLEQFFEVNDVPEDKRSAFLISVIGSDAYKSLRDLCHPVLPKDKPFESLCELLRKQFSPQISVFRERAKFYNSRQETHENVTQWYGKLKRLSVDCKFGSNLEAILLDKLITGLRPGQVLDRLCEEGETLKLDQALDIAVNKECAAKENAYAPGHPFRGGSVPFRPQPCQFGGQTVRQSHPFGTPKLAICPPAPANYFAGQVGGFGAPASSNLFGGAPEGVFAAKVQQDGEPQAALMCASAAPAALGCSADAEIEADGLPEGANPAGGAAAKQARTRTRRRGRGRRGAADKDSDKNSVDGE